MDDELAKRRLAKSPHRQGTAKCTNCGHNWIAVAPAGETILQCPSCLTNRGIYLGAALTTNSQWQCRCGEWAFFIDEQGPYCTNCGTRPDLTNMRR